MNKVTLFLLVFISSILFSQEKMTYQKPSKEILDLVDIEMAPRIMLDDKNEFMLLRYRSTFKSINELSEKEMRLAGLRINPKTNIGSRTRYYNNLKIKNLNDDEVLNVEGLPKNPRLANFNWSPDQEKIAFTNTTEKGVEVWVLDLDDAEAKKLTAPKVNANLRDAINWFADSESLLVKFLPEKRKSLIDVKSYVPTGPTISVGDGKKAQNRTYQDLLKTPADEHNFEQLALSELYEVDLDGSAKKWLDLSMYRQVEFSPNGEFVMVSTIEKPFSYIVPYYRFPTKTVIYNRDGNKINTVLESPLIEVLPKGFMATRKGRRSLRWRNDKPASLVYVEALDEGDPANKVEYRDEVFQLEKPFKGNGKSLLKVKNRFWYAEWGNNDIAIIHDRWWNNRNTKTYLISPKTPSKKAKIISDRSYQDRYNDPGQFVEKRNEMGRYVLDIKDNSVFLLGRGYSKKGQFPFLDELNLKSLKKKRVYQSKYTDKLELLLDFDSKNNQLSVRIESKNEYPNYYFRKLGSGLKQLTNFKNPFKAIEDVHKEVITYKRDDGLELSGTLYLPVAYDKSKKGKMPMILWAYPREYKDKKSASQNTKNPNRFTYLSYGSPVYWVAKGYVVLNGASFPIVGTGDEQPNDTFRKQLVANAKAAIDAVDKLGYIDRERVAVGGHSYGAFMVANLLSHSDLFAAGIARSGAYNRTLTPFGFQSEERSYWEAPNVYNTMSPFMHSDKMKTPLLLIHGEADNNSGTYPLQSERYFNALKGHGATVRLVMLPKESHGYRAKESILHMLWEQDQWLQKYVKDKPVQISSQKMIQKE